MSRSSEEYEREAQKAMQMGDAAVVFSNLAIVAELREIREVLKRLVPYSYSDGGPK